MKKHPALTVGGPFDVDWRNSVGYLLRDTTRMLLRATTVRIAPYGLTLTQYFLMRQLWDADGPTQRDLARSLDVPEPGLAAILDALEELGLIERRRSKSDRRKTHVHVTHNGRKLRQKLLIEGATVLNESLAGVSDRCIVQLRATLKRMKGNLDDLLRPPESAP